MIIRVLITGSVQGVGFRQFVRFHAKKRGVTGWVKNLPTGFVEAYLQGEESAINEMVALCKKGPFLAQVTDVLVTKSDRKEQFPSFTILHD